MDFSPLDEVREIVAANTHGGPSLQLFALLKTLSADNGQYLYLLNKLREMSPEHRQLAYRLMELMAQGGNQQAEWRDAVNTIEDRIRRG